MILFFFTLLVLREQKFIIQDDKKIVKKVLKGTEKMDRKDDKLTLARLKFSMKGFK